jgi:hypothetical protein
MRPYVLISTLIPALNAAELVDPPRHECLLRELERAEAEARSRRPADAAEVALLAALGLSDIEVARTWLKFDDDGVADALELASRALGRVLEVLSPAMAQQLQDYYVAPELGRVADVA